MSARLFTSESVTEGHPDKICDQISDSILDAMLAQDPQAPRRGRDDGHDRARARRRRGDHEAYVDIPQHRARHRRSASATTRSHQGLRRPLLRRLDLDRRSSRPTSPRASTRPTRTAPAGVDPLDKQGAGDQGLMFGYACEDTAELMPLPIHLAHRLAERLTEVRKNGELAYLRPDGKTQVTIGYDGDRAVRLDTVVLSTQHAADVSLEGLLEPDIADHVIEPVLAELADAGTDLDTQRLPRC